MTIIHDDSRVEEARMLAEVAVDRGAWPVLMNNEIQVRRGLADTHFPMAPPRNLHNAMTNSDEIIIVTNLEWANRFAHVSAVKESCANNAKIASVEPGMGDWDLTLEEIDAATQRARDAMAALEGATKVRDDLRQGHRRDGHDRGPAGARDHADQEARPDDGPAAALGGGRVRRGRGPDRRAPWWSTA